MKTTDKISEQELNEGLAMSSIIDNTIGWLDQRCADLHNVQEEWEFAKNGYGIHNGDDMAFAVMVARQCAKDYGFGHHADDDEIFTECEDEYRKASNEIDDLRIVGNEGEYESMRKALYECRREFGKPLGDHWARMYDNGCLCGWNSVEELISYF